MERLNGLAGEHGVGRIDMVEDRSQALVFDASRVGDGPIARVTLPERISSGTHSTWAPGSALPGWDAA